ncbi:MAG: DUF4870 domain-containing protein [Nanoarchaeota archaeon]
MTKKTTKKSTKTESMKKAPAKKKSAAKGPEKKVQKKVENENIASALTYIVLGIIWFFIDEEMYKSSLAKFHTKQAINLWIVIVLLNFLSALLFFLAPLISTLAGMFALVLVIIGIINGLNAEKKELPIIGQAAKKYLKF